MVGTRLHVVVSFVLFVCIAAPFAWRFTQIERVELPEARIQRLSWQDSRFGKPERFRVAIFTLNADDGGANSNDATAPLVSAATPAGRIEYTAPARLQLTTAQRKELQTATSRQSVDDIIAQSLRSTATATTETPQDFSIVLLCGAVTDLTPRATTDALVVGKYRHAWSATQCTLAADTALFYSVEQLLQQHVFPVATAVAASTSSGPATHARIANKYRLQFALLPERPDISWRWAFVESLYPRYIAPFIEKVSVLAHFTIESDVLYYARLATDVYASEDDRNAYFVHADDLKQFKSANDFLTSSVLDDREQVLHFLAALPSLEHSPLGIRPRADDGSDTDKKRLASSFAIPGWGSVAIFNTTRLVTGSSSARDQQQEERRVMGAFVAQLRTLLGAPAFAARQQEQAQSASTELVFLASPRDGIADWELDCIVRSRLHHYLQTSIATLQSLVELVAAMPQMSVLERVQQRIVASVELLEAILCTDAPPIDSSSSNFSMCDASTDVRTALRLVRDAAEHADAAYYDHTMIRQLYFPQEQMFGVYAPLLAPLILPFFFGLIRETKRWRTKRAAKTQMV